MIMIMIWYQLAAMSLGSGYNRTRNQDGLMEQSFPENNPYIQ